MGNGIFLINEKQELVELGQEDYDSEALLQGFLESHPSLIPGAKIDSDNPRRWLLVKREAPIPSSEGWERWSADHLFLDQDAVPTIVEVKRATDTRIRREVVGQMLDYAANAVAYWPVERIRSHFEETCEGQNKAPEEVLLQFLETEEVGDFWGRVKTNLQAGRVRLLFVADRIPTELQQIIEFLNVQMDPAEVLGVEISQYVGQGLKALVPRLVGQTAEAQVRKSSGKRESRDWDRESFLADLGAKAGPRAVETAERLLGWAAGKEARINWGRGAQDGSFSPWLLTGDDYGRTFAVYSNGSVEIQFQFMKTKHPGASRERRKNLLERVNKIPGVNIPESKLALRPSFKIDLLEKDEHYQTFIQAIEAYASDT